MEKLQLDEAAAVALTRKLYHAHFSGRPEVWFEYLCPESVYVGSGEPIVFGGDAIRAHFEALSGQAVDLLKEDYHPVYVGAEMAQVCGQLVVQQKEGHYRLLNRFTVTFRVVGKGIKLTQIHNSYEYYKTGTNELMNMDTNSMSFVRALLTDRPSGQRMAFKSCGKTIFLNPKNILYVQSQRKKTELVCVDCVIACNSSLSELAETLPAHFYPLHRCYLVNTQWVTAIRRFEVELVGGVTLPIPAANFGAVREAILAQITVAQE